MNSNLTTFLGFISDDGAFPSLVVSPDGDFYWGNANTLTVAVAEAAVPEPATLSLLGLGLVGIGVRRWRARKVT